jgi:hypothetical protein
LQIDAKIPDHKPGGGNVKIFDQKPQLTNVSSKVGSLDVSFDVQQATMEWFRGSSRREGEKKN